MGKLIDIQLPANGVFITLFRLFQVGILFDNSYVDISMSVWKAGIHLHMVYEEKNRCHVENHKQI